MSKIIVAGFVFIVIVLLSLSAAEAWSLPFKFVKNTVKQTDSAIKQDVKQEATISKAEQLRINNKLGMDLERGFKTAWCKSNKCASSLEEFNKIKAKYGHDTIYITSDNAARNYMQQIDALRLINFNSKPDMLKIVLDGGAVKQITIYDVKSSQNAMAIAEQRGQFSSYKGACDLLNSQRWNKLFCSIEYILPKTEAQKLASQFAVRGKESLTCLGTGIILGGLDPTDVVCAVPLLKNGQVTVNSKGVNMVYASEWNGQWFSD
ncbi:MAG TPA: hypothetical protein HA224_01990 [Nanoarchaeota archaeon]|nr:hypothetical protein [Nanoarchaeota archaeon]